MKLSELDPVIPMIEQLAIKMYEDDPGNLTKWYRAASTTRTEYRARVVQELTKFQRVADMADGLIDKLEALHRNTKAPPDAPEGYDETAKYQKEQGPFGPRVVRVDSPEQLHDILEELFGGKSAG